jgi:hypothetical protein
MATNRDRFLRLSKARLEKTKKQIELIGNLSDSTNYSYTEEEVIAIFDVLEAELEKAKNRFRKKKYKRGIH